MAGNINADILKLFLPIKSIEDGVITYSTNKHYGMGFFKVGSRVNLAFYLSIEEAKGKFKIRPANQIFIKGELLIIVRL